MFSGGGVGLVLKIREPALGWVVWTLPIVTFVTSDEIAGPKAKNSPAARLRKDKYCSLVVKPNSSLARFRSTSRPVLPISLLLHSAAASLWSLERRCVARIAQKPRFLPSVAKSITALLASDGSFSGQNLCASSITTKQGCHNCFGALIMLSKNRRTKCLRSW